MPLGPLLLLMFLAVPLVEVALFVQVGDWIGLWPTLLAIVVTALLGSAVIRHQGFALAQRARTRLAAGTMPLREGFDGLCLVGAGLLMITPGFFTDAVGGLLLVPPLRGALYGALAKRVHVEVPPGFDDPTRPRDPPRHPPRDVVDADYEVVDDEDGDGEPRRMPPPGGGWDREDR